LPDGARGGSVIVELSTTIEKIVEFKWDVSFMLTLKTWILAATVTAWVGILWRVCAYIWKYRKATTPKAEKQAIGRRLRDFRNGALISILFGFGIVFALPWVADHGDEIITSLASALGKRTAQALVALSVTILGGAAYFLKRRRQQEYGVIEIAFGGIGTFVALAHIDPKNFFTTLVALGGCVYFVVSGFSNVWEGEDARAKRERDRSVQELVESMRSRA
jgi:hypothetical protein